MSDHPRHLTSRARLTPGTQIDHRYTIVDLLGMGGYATVYQAQQLSSGREVALKLLTAWNPSNKRDDPKTIYKRFIREVNLTQQINHPNAVTIEDYGWIQNATSPVGYLVMELLRGCDLAREIGLVGSIAPKRALGLLDGCLSALAVAHDENIVHGDLKPSNLFLHHKHRSEALVLLDFGVARRVAISETFDAQCTGTPQYLAPEYITRGQITPAADVYQMGLILVEMLTGHTVVNPRTTDQCFRIHTSGRLTLPAPLLDSSLGPILMRALARAPESRFPNARALQEALACIDPAHIKLKAHSGHRKTLAHLSGSRRSIVRPPNTTAEWSFAHTDEFEVVPQRKRLKQHHPSMFKPIRVTQSATPGSFSAPTDQTQSDGWYNNAQEAVHHNTTPKPLHTPHHQSAALPFAPKLAYWWLVGVGAAVVLLAVAIVLYLNI